MSHAPMATRGWSSAAALTVLGFTLGCAGTGSGKEDPDTVAAVDADEDGVRDDVEAYIDAFTADSAGRTALRDVAASMQTILDLPADDVEGIRAAAQDANVAVACAFHALGDASEPVVAIQNLTLGEGDTLTRWTTRQAALGGEVYTVIPASERATTCAARGGAS